MDCTRIPRIAFVTVLCLFMVTSMSVAFTAAIPGVDSDHNGTARAQTEESDLIYTASADNTVKALYSENGSTKWTYTGHTDIVNDVSVGPDGEFVYSGSRDNTVVKLDASDGSEMWTFSGHTDDVQSVASGPDGDFVYSSDFDDTLKKVNASDGTLEQNEDLPDYATNIVVDPDGSSVYASLNNDDFISIDTSDLSTGWTYTGDSSGEDLAMDPEGEFVYSVLGTGTETIAISTDTGTVEWGYNGHVSFTDGVTTSPFGDYVYTTEDDNIIRSLDSDTGSEEWSNTHSGFETEPITINSNGDELYVGSDSAGDVAAMDSSDGSEIWTISPHSDYIVDLSATGEYPSVEEWEISGTVTDRDGDPISDVTIETNTSASNTTDSEGFYNISLEDGTYNLTASKDGYTSVTEQITVDGANVEQDFQLESINQSINLDTKRYIPHGERADYRVVVTNDTGRHNVTGEATVTSGNVSVVTVDTSVFELQATNDTSVNQRTYVQADWNDGEGNTYTDRRNVTVANATVDNLDILPTWTKVSASLGHETLQVIIVSTMVGSAAAIFAGSFAGLTAAQGVVALGWFGGMVSDGIMIMSFLFAIFVGLNLAGNLSMQVRQ